MAKCANHPVCSQTDTFFSNSALDNAPGDTSAHQHFALFGNATDINVFYLGSEDWFGNPMEGNGDFNDMVFKINSDAVPEPTTFALLGIGLLSLALVRLPGAVLHTALHSELRPTARDAPMVDR